MRTTSCALSTISTILEIKVHLLGSATRVDLFLLMRAKPLLGIQSVVLRPHVVHRYATRLCRDWKLPYADAEANIARVTSVNTRRQTADAADQIANPDKHQPCSGLPHKRDGDGRTTKKLYVQKTW